MWYIQKHWINFLIGFVVGLFTTLPVFAALPSQEWRLVDHPSVDAFYVNTSKKEYITVVKNQADVEMEIASKGEADISHVLTLFRRVSLKPFGITDWKVLDLQKSKYKAYIVLKIHGTYRDSSKKEIQFYEHMYYIKNKFTQFSWIRTSGSSPSGVSGLEPLLKSLENDYL